MRWGDRWTAGEAGPPRPRPHRLRSRHVRRGDVRALRRRARAERAAHASGPRSHTRAGGPGQAALSGERSRAALVASGAFLIACRRRFATTPWHRDPRPATTRRGALGPGSRHRRAARAPARPRSRHRRAAARAPSRAPAPRRPLPAGAGFDRTAAPRGADPPPPPTAVVVTLGRCCRRPGRPRESTRSSSTSPRSPDRPGTHDLLRLARFFARSRLSLPRRRRRRGQLQPHGRRRADGLPRDLLEPDDARASSRSGYIDFSPATWLAATRASSMPPPAGSRIWARSYRIPIRRCAGGGDPLQPRRAGRRRHDRAPWRVQPRGARPPQPRRPRAPATRGRSCCRRHARSRRRARVGSSSTDHPRRPAGPCCGMTPTSPLAEALAPELLERFLRYVRVDTQSRAPQERPARAPRASSSSAGCSSASCRQPGSPTPRWTSNGYVFATLPATPGRRARRDRPARAPRHEPRRPGRRRRAARPRAATTAA